MSISSANASILIGVASVFVVPQALAGFSADDIFDSDPIDTAEVQMGVDGELSAGFVFQPVKWNVTLQADSASNSFFENWYTAEVVAKDKFLAFGNVSLPGINRNFVMTNGALTSYPVMPNAGKFLKPRKYQITWGKVLPVPTA